MTKDERTRRERGIKRLCKILNVGPAFICDHLLTLAAGEPSIDPSKMETLLKMRGLLKENVESIKECLARQFGKDIAELAESLI